MFKVGLVGKRSLAYVPGLRSVDGLHVTDLCEVDLTAEASAREQGIEGFTSDFEALLGRVDAVVLGTPMHLHAVQSIQALQAGRAVLSEVTAAVTVDECQQLKATSGTYMFAENYCYFEQNLTALELAKQGRFGDIYYGEGDYVHEVRFLHRSRDGKPTWRMEWQVGARGNTYCTHELGPLMRMFRAADPGVRVATVACFGTGTHTDPTLNHDDNTLTLVKLSNGALLKLRLDMVSNRPHSVRYELQGVLGAYESDHSHRFWFGENRPVHWDDAIQREWKDIGEFRNALPGTLREEIEASKAHGHGGGDYMVGRRFAQALVGGVEPEIGLHDAVEWTMVGLLSQESILQGGAPVPMPAWVYA
ncbi:MAG: Gfo/Idh/MocA family oxidoreductase [Armatimonadetes bacterium]|nr:Gfo/Idh/MocA family oxidoreductase [Armatimonadota bacterium]